MKIHIASILIFLLSLIGCATIKERGEEMSPSLTGASEVEVLQNPPPEFPPEEYEQKARLTDIPPVPQKQPPPIYPQTALQSEISCTARLLYHILKDGSSKLVRLEWDESPPDNYREAFEDAIQQAVSTWKFTPANRVVPKGMPDGRVTYLLKAVPYAGRAIIRFYVYKGKGIVE